MGWQHHVTIQGHVKSPGRYELARAMKLSDLIFEAGGLLPGADLERAELVRLKEDGTSQTFAIDLELLLVACDPDEDLKLEKDDAVFVRQLPDRLEPEKVLIEGEVRFPGHYSLTRRGEPLSAVLARAGGLTEDAFAGGAVFTRTAINEHIERQNVLPVFMSFRADSVTGIPMGIAPWLNDLKPDLLPTNRMAIDLPRLLESGGRRGDVPLQDGDRLLVPRRPSGVPVIGHVAAAGTVQYASGKSVGYYLDRAGGVTESGDKGGLRVVRANGEVLQCGRGKRIEMGDSIVVPPRTRPPRDWSWLKSTIGMVGGATAAAVILNQID
jgi:protein involved in polysaccharide export with SLBB domain